MTATGSEADAVHSPLAGTPNPNNNNEANKPVPMEVDPTDAEEPISENNEKSANLTSPAVEVASPNLGSVNTPKSALLKTPADVFKTPDQPSTPTSSSKKRKRLTPEEKNLRERERQEKRQKLEEEKQKREEEKQKKEQEKLEKAKQREEERLKREEEKRRVEEEKKREKEKKEEERLKKEEEKRKLEEERKREKEKKEEEKRRLEEEKQKDKLKKEEERKKKEDEKRKQVEEKEKERQKEEEKKAKQAQIFTSFFQKSATPKTVKTVGEGIVYPKNTGSTVPVITLNDEKEKTENSTTAVDNGETAENGASPQEGPKPLQVFNPLPFQIKTDMAVAPVCRREKLSSEEISALDVVVTRTTDKGDEAPVAELLNVFKNGKGRTYGRTKIMKAEDDDIQVLEDDLQKPENLPGYIKYRMKLLQFEENRRPSYWGTWKRKGKKVSARKPFAQEEEIDYEFDSDDEWEDEPEDAEEIGDSDKEDPEDKEEPEDEDDEEGWMVPHGYLSDTEREGTGGDIESMKTKEKEFYKSLKEKTMIGLPYIESYEDLNVYAMLVCPVFKSADPIKPVRKRAKPADKKTDKTDDTESNSNSGLEPADLKNGETETSSPSDVAHKRKPSKRARKVPDNKNPYAKPPSGFLALELPSDDDDDMDWGEDEESSGSSSSSCSEDDLNDEELENDHKLGQPLVPESDSDLDDLFIPVSKKKKSSSPSNSSLPPNSN